MYNRVLDGCGYMINCWVINYLFLGGTKKVIRVFGTVSMTMMMTAVYLVYDVLI